VRIIVLITIILVDRLPQECNQVRAIVTLGKHSAV